MALCRADVICILTPFVGGVPLQKTHADATVAPAAR